MHTNLYFWISFAIYSEQLAVFKIDITGSVLTKSYWSVSVNIGIIDGGAK